MPKAGEKTYFGAVGADHALNTLNKPFAGSDNGALMSQIAAIASLLPPAPSKLLDLGVGTGWTSLFYSRMGYEVVAQDISEEAITLAKRHQRSAFGKSVRFIVSDYESMNYESEFDCAVFFDSLHHAEDEVAALRSVYQVLKPGGILITSEPGKGHGASKQAREAVEKFGVTERDMPPTLIIGAAKQAGFKHYKVYPDMGLIHKAFLKTDFSRPILNRLSADPMRLALANYLVLRKSAYQGMVVLLK